MILSKYRVCVKWVQNNYTTLRNTFTNQHTRGNSTHLHTHTTLHNFGHHQIVSTEIRLIIFFAAKDEEALYRQQKQDRELAVAQIMNSLLQNSDSN